jgi:hypothetical protein
MGSIMGSQKIMGSDYGSNISEYKKRFGEQLYYSIVICKDFQKY